MPPVDGLFWIWGQYLLFRILLVTTEGIDRIRVCLEQVPVCFMGTVHSYTLFSLFLCWRFVRGKMFHVHMHLLLDTFADEFVWIPYVPYEPWGC